MREKMTMFKKCFWMLLLGSLLITPAYAYLDGGTGSVIVQGLLAGIAGFLTVLKIYWQKVKKIIQHLFAKTSKAPDDKNA
jgi:hypothetical protein